MNTGTSDFETITRTGGNYQFRVLEISAFEHWILSDSERIASSGLVISDLALGAWRGHQVASEFADQLGIELPAIDALPKHEGRDQKVRNEFIDQAVDAETRGHLGILVALDQASVLVGQLQKTGTMDLVVIAPLKGKDFGSQNIRFLQFLAEGLQAEQFRIWIVADTTNRAWVPQRWMLLESDPPCGGRSKTEAVRVDSRWANAPGVLPSVACSSPTGADVSAVCLPRDKRLVLPGERRVIAAASRLQILDAREGAPPWVVAYQQAQGRYPGSNLKPMGNYAWQCLRQGDLELGRRLMARGVEVAGFPSPAGDLLASLLAMQIASHQFEMAQQDSRRPRGVPLTMRQQWARGKALCAALTGKGAEAEALLQDSSDEPKTDPVQWTDLYARNLMALAYFLQKRADAALALQESISRSISESGQAGWQIRYLNAINTARLHRAAGRFEDARQRYADAFEVTDGVRLDGDFLYMNICLARIESDLGNQDQADLYWLRAGLHFAANPAPEALGWRTLSALLKRRVASGESCVNEIAETLVHTLRERLNIRETGDVPQMCYAHQASHKVQTSCRTILGGPGWAVLLSTSLPGACFDSRQHRQLRALLWTALQQSAQYMSDGAPPCIVVDAQFGREIPTRESEVLKLAARYRVDQLVYAGEIHNSSEHDWASLSPESLAEP